MLNALATDYTDKTRKAFRVKPKKRIFRFLSAPLRLCVESISDFIFILSIPVKMFPLFHNRQPPLPQQPVENGQIKDLCQP